MDKLIERTNFAEIYKYLKGRNKDAIWDFCENMLKCGAVLIPAFMSQDAKIAIAAISASTIFSGIRAAQKSKKSICDVFKNANHNDYSSKYNKMQIAQVLLIYSAFMDSINTLIPDKKNCLTINGKIFELSKNGIEKYCIEYNSEKNTKKFEDIELLREELECPNPTISEEEYEKKLIEFYKKLSEGVSKFFIEYCAPENNRESYNEQVMACIRDIPQNAYKAYRQQFFELASNIPDFNVWLSLQASEKQSKKIDVGFENISKELSLIKTDVQIIKEKILNSGKEALERCITRYKNIVSLPIIEDNELFGEISSTENIKKEDLFIPQHFKSVIYDENIILEYEKIWDGLQEHNIDISRFIYESLYHSCTNNKPLIVLGMPGAGKSLLSLMLSSKILSDDFYPVIVKLRDINPDLTISEQICRQIHNDSGYDVCWANIDNNNLDKPLLIIFDGFDELLQASKNSHNDYINRIVAFLKRDCNNIVVKTIITSRTALIDNVQKPKGCQVIKLCDFDEDQIDKWCEIWSNKTGKKLIVNKKCGYYEFAKQPLLLLMLALYNLNYELEELDDNVKKTELYNKLLRVFIERELLKKTDFSRFNEDDRDKYIEQELIKLSIVALGMYNRNKLYISTDIVRNDIKFLINEDSDNLMAGKFFFLLDPQTISYKNGDETKITAIEFLHNTFGEYLTTYYFEYALIRFFNKNNDEESIFDTNNQEILYNDYIFAAFCYSPMFLRPNIISMLYEKLETKSKKFKDKIYDIFKDIINNGLKSNLYSLIYNFLKKQGNYFDLKDITVSVANFIYNMLIVVLITNIKMEIRKDTWNKMICIFKNAYKDEEITKISKTLGCEFFNDKFVIEIKLKNERNYYATILYDTITQNKLSEELIAAKYIGDLKLYELCSCLTYTYFNVPDNVIAENDYHINSIHLWEKYCRGLYDDSYKTLLRIPEISIKELKLDVFFKSSFEIINLVENGNLTTKALVIITNIIRKIPKNLIDSRKFILNNEFYQNLLNTLLNKIVDIFIKNIIEGEYVDKYVIIEDLLSYIRFNYDNLKSNYKKQLSIVFYKLLTVEIDEDDFDMYFETEALPDTIEVIDLDVINLIRSYNGQNKKKIFKIMMHLFNKNDIFKLYDDKKIILKIINYLIYNRKLLPNINYLETIIDKFVIKYGRKELINGIFEDSLENLIVLLEMENNFNNSVIFSSNDLEEIINKLDKRYTPKIYIEYLVNYYKY